MHHSRRVSTDSRELQIRERQRGPERSLTVRGLVLCFGPRLRADAKI